MAFNKKYYFYFRDINNQQYTTEIWQDSYTGSSIEVRGDINPFSVSLSSLDSKFQPVRGSGCQINLLSQTDRQFLGLYTSNILEYQIRTYKGSSLIWCGYIDSELYSEPFNSLTNYPVSFSGSDGFALLERLNYVDVSGNHYTGISSQFDILKIILGKLNLPFSYSYIQLQTTISGTTNGTGETILNKTYINNNNFYNEDGEPETLRTVLESILQPYGAFIIQNNGSLYITDIQTITTTGNTFSFLKYSGNTLVYISAENTINKNIGDLSTIKFSSADQTLNIVSGVNKQVVKYSPYKETSILDFVSDEDFTIPGTVTTRGAINYRWIETEYSTSKTWNKLNDGKFCINQGLDDVNINTNEKYLKINNSGNINNFVFSTGIFYKGSESFNLIYTNKNIVSTSTKYFLKINMSAYFRTFEDMNNNTLVADSLLYGFLHCDLIVGNNHYNFRPISPNYVSTNGWVSLATTGQLILEFSKRNSADNFDFSKIGDTWNDLKTMRYIYSSTPSPIYGIYLEPVYEDFLIPLDTFNGEFTFKIYGYTAYNTTDKDYSYAGVKDCRIKDIKLTVVDSNGNDVEEQDIEYVGYMNAQYKNEGESIDIIQGSNMSEFPTERGGLLKYDGTNYSWIKLWTRAGITDNLENLLLRSYVGNYEGKTLELTCSTNLVSSLIGYLTYINYLSTTKFMITSCTHNYAEATSELTLQEIFVDSLTINKSF